MKLLIEGQDLKDIINEFRRINRAKSTPALTRLQFEHACNLIEKAMDRALPARQILENFKKDARKQVKKELATKRNGFQAVIKERQAHNRAKA
jgi:hypothetical protein